MNRISRSPAAGHTGHRAAAAVPSTVIGGITGATTRFAITATRLSWPEIAATSGAVTSCAASAMPTASASGLGHPRATSAADQTGATTIRAAVATTDNAKPAFTASCGAKTINEITVAASTGMPWRRRADTTAISAIAPITAARSTLAVGCTTITNTTSATAASATAARGPTSRADSNTAPQTIVTLAPDTAVRCVRPAMRNSAVVVAVTVAVSPRTRPGSIAAGPAGNASRAAAANRVRTPAATRWTTDAAPNTGLPTTVSVATVRSRRAGREIRARNRTGWPALNSAKSTPEAKTTTLPVMSSSAIATRAARNISRPFASARGLSSGVTVTAAVAPNSRTAGW